MRRLAVAAVVATVAVAGCSAPAATDTPEPVPTVTVTVTQTAPAPQPTETAETEPAEYQPSKSDWNVKVKIVGKECFGSAGCNVDLAVEPEFVGDPDTLPDTGTIEVTYEITGAEDEFIDSFTVVDKSMEWDKDQSVQTAKSSTKLKTKVTAVDYTTY